MKFIICRGFVLSSSNLFYESFWDELDEFWSIDFFLLYLSSFEDTLDLRFSYEKAELLCELHLPWSLWASCWRYTNCCKSFFFTPLWLSWRFILLFNRSSSSLCSVLYLILSSFFNRYFFSIKSSIFFSLIYEDVSFYCSTRTCSLLLEDSDSLKIALFWLSSYSLCLSDDLFLDKPIFMSEIFSLYLCISQSL